MNTELSKISSWLVINKLTLNVNKCNLMVYNIRNIHSDTTFNIEINGSAIEQVNSIHFLGIFIDNKMNWKHDHNFVSSKLSRMIIIF